MVHLLTGSHPQDLPKDIDTGAIIWRDRAPAISPDFADLLDSMMNHLPVQRPVNIEAISNALNHNSDVNLPSSFRSVSPRKFSRSILVGIVAVPLSFFGLFSLVNTFSQQQAAQEIAITPLCNNFTCVNRDPIDNKCDNDAQTITSDIGNYQLGQELMAYRLEIRYSKNCDAVCG